MIDRWDRFFMELARVASSMSKDPSTKVGAVLARDREVVALGFNGFPPGVEDNDRLLDRAKKYELVVHAELNALLRAGASARGTTLYLYKLPPCLGCAKHVIAAGVREIVYHEEPPARWADEVAKARSLLQEAGVPVRRAWIGAPRVHEG